MSDSRKSLPARPSLTQLQKQAKELLQAWRARELDALRRARTFHYEEMKLAGAQFVIAREHGFDSWAKLKRGVETIQAPGGLNSHPPLYRIDWDHRMLEPRQPMSATEWDRIADFMKDLRLTVLNASRFMTDDAMQCISKLGHVTSLRLGGANQLTDEGLKRLVQMPQLEELELNNYPGGTITDRGLESLRDLRELRTFQMCWQSGISDAGVANLQACEKLVRVDLQGAPTGDGAINALRGKRNLRQLKTGRLVTDSGLSMLRDFPAFKTWQGGTVFYDLMSFGDNDPNVLMVDGPLTDQGVVGALAAGLPQALSARMSILLGLRLMFVLYGRFVSWLLYLRLHDSHVEKKAPSPPLGPPRSIVYRLAMLFSIDSFAGGLVLNSLLALWLYEPFSMSLAAAGAFFFWTGLLSGTSQLAAGPLAKRIGLLNTMVFTHIPSSLCLIGAALTLLLVRSLLSQMDVPARGAFVMSVVTPEERPAGASATALPRSLASAASPPITGAFFAAGAICHTARRLWCLEDRLRLALFTAFRSLKT